MKKIIEEAKKIAGVEKMEYDKGINEIIINMYNKGHSEDDIADIVKKSLDYVRGIINERNK